MYVLKRDGEFHIEWDHTKDVTSLRRIFILHLNHPSSTFMLNSFQNIQQHDNNPHSVRTITFSLLCDCISIPFYLPRAAASLPTSFSHFILVVSSCYPQLSSNNGSCFHLPFTTFPSGACQLWFLLDHTRMVWTSSERRGRKRGELRGPIEEEERQRE